MQSPVRWYGGKGKMTQKIVPVLQGIPHRVYVERLAGGASILLAKRPAPVEVYNDIYGDLVNLFKVIADPDLYTQFERRVWLLPCSRALFYNAALNVLKRAGRVCEPERSGLPQAWLRSPRFRRGERHEAQDNLK